MMRRLIPLVMAAACAAPAIAREALGVFGQWGAFRDPEVPRCHAIAMANPSSLAREFQPYADVGTWPRQGVRGQVHFHLSRSLVPKTPVMLAIGGQRFALTASGAEAWAADQRMDAAITAAMRQAPGMVVSAIGQHRGSFTNSYDLAGAASAMDAAALGCARL